MAISHKLQEIVQNINWGSFILRQVTVEGMLLYGPEFFLDRRLRQWCLLSWSKRHESSKSFGTCVAWKKRWENGQFLLKTYGTSGSLISTILRTFFGAISCQIAQISSRNGNDRVTGHSQRQKQAKMIESVRDYWDFSPRVLRNIKIWAKLSQIVVFFGFSMIDFVRVLRNVFKIQQVVPR